MGRSTRKGWLVLVLALGLVACGDDSADSAESGDGGASGNGGNANGGGNDGANSTDNGGGSDAEAGNNGGSGGAVADAGASAGGNSGGELGTDCAAQTKPHVAFDLVFSEASGDLNIGAEGIKAIETAMGMATYVEEPAALGMKNKMIKLGLDAAPSDASCPPAAKVTVQRVTGPAMAPSDGEKFDGAAGPATADKAVIGIDSYKAEGGCGSAGKGAGWTGDGGTVTFAVDGTKVTATLADVLMKPNLVGIAAKGTFKLNGTITTNCWK